MTDKSRAEEEAREILKNCESIGNWGKEAEDKITQALLAHKKEISDLQAKVNELEARLKEMDEVNKLDRIRGLQEKLKALEDALRVAREAIQYHLYKNCDCKTEDGKFTECLGHLALKQLEEKLK